MGDAARMVNDGSRAGVGGANHGALKLNGAHAGNVQVLVNGHRVAKPADVADIDHHGRGLSRVKKPRGEFFAKQIFIANIGRNALALPFKRCLLDITAIEVGQRHVDDGQKPLEQRVHKLAKRHQVVLVVLVNGLRASRR